MHNLIAPDFLYAVSGFCVGALVGMTGVGGGSLLTPLLILLFGVQPTTAVGTDLLFAASTKATGTIVHSAARTIDWLLVAMLAIGSVPATIATLFVLSQFDLKGAAAQHAAESEPAGNVEQLRPAIDSDLVKETALLCELDEGAGR